MLYGRALAELKKNCTPKVTYEIEGYADTGIGDTVRITDEEYNPILYLEARVTEQVRSITDESRNKTIYSNVEVLKSEVDSSLMARVEALIKENKVYIGQIMSDNGIQFVNGEGSTTLTAQVMDASLTLLISIKSCGRKMEHRSLQQKQSSFLLAILARKPYTALRRSRTARYMHGPR